MLNSTISSACSSGSEPFAYYSVWSLRGERSALFPHAAPRIYRKFLQEYGKSHPGHAKRPLCVS